MNNQDVAHKKKSINEPAAGLINDSDFHASDSIVDAPLFNPESFENMPTKEDRLIRKAKRTLKIGSAKDDAAVGSVNGFHPNVTSPTSSTHSPPKLPLAVSKNSRKSRSAFSRNRGQPKKGGAGGKGVWGIPGSELNEVGTCRDVHDPNYDSDSQEEYKLEKVVPVLTEDQVDKAVEPIVLEYFEHGNTHEVESLLHDLNIGPNRHKIVKTAIALAMDRHNAQREMISRLISDLYSCVLSQDDIGKAFKELLSSLDDMVLDTPEAHLLLGQFIARCVADDCLPPKFITSYKGQVENDWIRSSLDKAEILLTMNHGIAHLDSIWGVGGGNRPVKYLTNKIIDLLREYVSSGDAVEATRCLQELEVPHFHHEFIYQDVIIYVDLHGMQAGDMVIEDSSDRVRDLMVHLLKHVTSTNFITANEFDKGMRRLFNDIHDIYLDVPAAYVLLEQFAIKLHAERVLGNELLKDLPMRGRKRFVSEGDGGKLKPGNF